MFHREVDLGSVDEVCQGVTCNVPCSVLRTGNCFI